MITVFSIPKPFTGDIALIQRNAVRSWSALGPDVQVVLVGDESGIADAAHEGDPALTEPIVLEPLSEAE